jgi:thymidylate synthase
MKNYQELLQDILDNGHERGDRTGTGTLSVFGRTMRFDLQQRFPAVTTKKLAWKAVVGELLWFIEGSSSERRLAEITHGSPDGAATIWTPNALAPYWKPKAQFEGDLGRVYGVQWRHWNKYTVKKEYGDSHHGGQRLAVDRTEVDQLADLISGLKNDPNSRRHMLSAWNVGELDSMALPPCHVLSQYYVDNQRRLSCHMYQRSQDVFLGAPFNYASYALLTHMIAHVCGYTPGELIVSTGDTHIYLNHLEQVKEQLKREPLQAPTLWLNPNISDIDSFSMDDIRLDDYNSHGQLRAPMAV